MEDYMTKARGENLRRIIAWRIRSSEARDAVFRWSTLKSTLDQQVALPAVKQPETNLMQVWWGQKQAARQTESFTRPAASRS